MPWFKVDDHFWSHPKTAQLSDGATSLWLRAGSWSAGHLTDGRVPVSMLRMFRARRRSADELVAAGLWSIVRDTSVERPSNAGDTFVFNSWHEYQPSKAQVETKREATRTRVNAWRERHGNGVTDHVTNTSPDGDGNAPPDPTRPDPTTTSNEVVKTVPRKRGTRLPDGWNPEASTIETMRHECPAVDLRAEHAVFTDYWVAQPGQKGIKTDWDATWRNWMRRKQGDTAKRPTPEQRARTTLALATDIDTKEISG